MFQNYLRRSKICNLNYPLSKCLPVEVKVSQITSNMCSNNFFKLWKNKSIFKIFNYNKTLFITFGDLQLKIVFIRILPCDLFEFFFFFFFFNSLQAALMKRSFNGQLISFLCKTAAELCKRE